MKSSIVVSRFRVSVWLTDVAIGSPIYFNNCSRMAVRRECSGKARWCMMDFMLLLEKGNMGEDVISDEEYRYGRARRICMQSFSHEGLQQGVYEHLIYTTSNVVYA